MADVEDSQEVFASKVNVIPSAGDHESGSSKVKLHNIVDYTWEERFYTGQLLAVHIGGVYIAYGIKAPHSTTGIVRIVNRQTNERTLIKQMEGSIQDIAFAHIAHEVLLAIVDLAGNLYIYKVIEEKMPPRLFCEEQLRILPDPNYVTQPGEFYRVIWCPFIPELPEENPDDDQSPTFNEDLACLLALLRGKKVELWNVKLVVDHHGSGPVTPGMVEIGYLEINEHSKPIVDAAFAPDGTAVATASLDGDIKFFQVYMQNGKKPRCLHQWQPHEGQPVYSLFFLDNHKNYNPDIQFWKFAITGSNNNSELKVWSCESWVCLQTIKFQVTPNMPIKLKASMDLASGYLLLSDFHHKVLYVLELLTNNNETSAAIISISEFHLPYPILSFGIVNAGLQRFKSQNLEEVCNNESDDESVLGVLIRMYLVQPKSLQDCEIAFIPPKPGSQDRSQLMVNESILYHDALPDIPLNVSNGDLSSPKSNIQDLPANHNHSSLHLNLMTPDAFNSSANKLDTSGSSLIKSLTEADSTYSNTTTALVVSPQSPEETDDNLLTDAVENAVTMGFASGGSSPSREVQEILGERKCYYQDTDDIQQEQEHVELTPPEAKVPTVWPELPILKATEVIKNEEQARRSATANQGEFVSSMNPGEFVNSMNPAEFVSSIKQGEFVRSINPGEFVNSTNQGEFVSSMKQGEFVSSMNQNESGDAWKANQRLETSISSMIHIMNSLTQAVDEQANEIKQLREELHQQNTVGEIDKLLTCSSQQQMLFMEKLFANKDNLQQESLAASISQTIVQSVMNFLSSKFLDSVNNEISKTATPLINNNMEELKHQIDVKLTQKLSTTDHLLKDSITKLVQSKSVMEVLSAAVVSSITPVLSQCYKDYFTSVVIPNFEKSCSSMFTQINDVFSKGSKEFVVNLEAQSRKISEKNRDQGVQMQALADMVKTSVSQLTVEMKKSVAGLEKHVLETMSSALTLQQATLEGSVIAAVRSRAVTPAPHIIDTQLQQSQILQLISQGQVNSAFQQALSASDLSLVVFVCEKVNPQQLFSQVPCPLQQHVLLSLIQQLSADMNNQTEIKHKYLEEALMNLDVNNPVTQEHLPTVLSTLQCQLQAYIKNNPNNRITRSMRILLMASQALLTSR